MATRSKSIGTGRHCKKCGTEITKRPGGKTACPKCSRDREARYRRDDPARRVGYRKKYAVEVRDAVLKAYGESCACCGEHRREFLTIDHADGKGHEHRKEIGRGGLVFYNWLRRNKYPAGFRTLCMNCNFSRGLHGYCPHEREARHEGKGQGQGEGIGQRAD